MGSIRVENLTKAYSDSAIPVKDVSFEVKNGEFLALLGPSGCGKSTLLRLIAGLESPTSGKIFINGKEVTYIPPAQRNVSMVFQSYALYPHMTVFDNILSPLKLRKVPKAIARTQGEEVLSRLGMTHLKGRKPGQLSGGQRQRVALARALVRDPEVFLLDEPLSNLDAFLREQVRRELKSLFGAQEKPVIYVTHDQVEAMSMSSKMAVLSEGKIQQLDDPKTVYQHPATLFIGQFIGSPAMNTLPAKILSRFCDHTASVPLDIVKTVGIRPENIDICAPLSSEAGLEGTVEIIEHMGGSTLYSVRLLQHEHYTNSLVQVLSDADFTVGDLVRVSSSTSSLHLFDEEGKRILDHNFVQ